MDPQQRIFLQTVWKAVEDAGYPIEALSHTKTGLFVGFRRMIMRSYCSMLMKPKRIAQPG